MEKTGSVQPKMMQPQGGGENERGSMADNAGGNGQGELKSVRKHFSRLGLMYMLGTLVVYGVQILAAALIYTWKPQWQYNADISLLVAMLPMYLIGMPALILLVRWIPAEKPVRHNMKPGQFCLALIMCFGLIYMCNILGTILTTIIGLLRGSEVDNVMMNAVGGTSILLNFVIVVLCAPVIEEFVFRKLIVDRTVRYGQGVAVLLSGLMFGLFHGNLNQFVYAFALGMFLAFLYVKTGKLIYTVVIHMSVNFMGSIVSMWILKYLDLDAYMQAAETGDMEQILSVIMDCWPAWLAYLCLALFMFATIIAGLVLFIVFRRKFRFDQGEVTIPRGKRFSTVILNVGMILYCVLWIAIIICQLFGLL